MHILPLAKTHSGQVDRYDLQTVLPSLPYLYLSTAKNALFSRSLRLTKAGQMRTKDAV
jgi:hypothetical protein